MGACQISYNSRENININQYLPFFIKVRSGTIRKSRVFPDELYHRQNFGLLKHRNFLYLREGRNLIKNGKYS